MKKNKRRWIPPEERYAPLFRDSGNVLYRNGDHTDRFDGHFLPADAYFGQLVDGRRFIAIVKGQKVGMVSHIGLSMWENTFYQSIFDLLRKAGVRFGTAVPTGGTKRNMRPRVIHTAKDLLQQGLYSEKVMFYPFADYVLFVADSDNPLYEVGKRAFKKFQVTPDSMQEIKNVTEKIFRLEQEYMESHFLQMELDENRRKLIDEWYSSIGCKERMGLSGTESVPIIETSQNDLYLIDMVYLKWAHVKSVSGLHPESTFFCYLVLESARQLKKEPLTGENVLLYQKAVEIHKEKKNLKRVGIEQNVDDTNKHRAAEKQKAADYSEQFKAEKHTLYVYQGKIKCIREHHPIDCVTAEIPTASRMTAILNVNLCRECHRFCISYNEYADYLKKYKSLLTRIVLVNGNGTKHHSGSFAEVSPLKLCGYSVSQEKGFSQQERELILTEVIHNGIMKKTDVIQYLNWFIKMNGHKKENISAKEKWESDLEFVRSIDMNRQDRYFISKIVPYIPKKKTKR